MQSQKSEALTAVFSDFFKKAGIDDHEKIACIYSANMCIMMAELITCKEMLHNLNSKA